METTNIPRNSGITFGGLLQILFIGLKLTGYINWSWFWVLAPLWIELLLILFVGIIVLIINAIYD